MFTTKPRSMLALSMLAAVSLLLAGCGGAEQAEESAGTAELTPQEDFKQTMAAYEATDDKKEQAEIWLAFLERNPDSQYTFGTINYIVQQHYLGEEDDLPGAIDFVKAHMEPISNPQQLNSVKGLLLNLHARSGDVEAMQAMVQEEGGADALAADQHLAVAEAALVAEAYDMAAMHAEAAAEKTTPENIQAQNPDQELSEDRVERMVSYYKSSALETLAQAQMAMDQVDESIETFKQAAGYTSFNFVGVPSSNINVEWAKALIQQGKYEEAMARVAPDAVMQGADNAKEVFEEAYNKAAIDKSLEEVYADWRDRLAKEVPDFTVYSYDEAMEPVSYDSVDGEVTLLVFFFPT